MITPVNRFFTEWLDLMERAYYALSPEEFKELEDKELKEIAYARRAHAGT